MNDKAIQELREKVFAAIGEASMCWVPTPEGIFDSTRAEKVGKALVDEILSRAEAEQGDKGWKDMAAQMSRNAEYYRGLVIKIGDMFGEAAYTADDGSKSQSVLCAKVPELVEALIHPTSTADLIAELEKRRPCERCKHWRHNATPCMSCFWKGLWNMGEALHTDNFKEEK